MKRFHTNIRALDGSLQEALKVLQAIRVNRAINVGFGVVNHFGRILVKAIIRLQRIGVEFRTRRNVLANRTVKVMLPARAYNRGTNLACLTVEQTKHNRTAHRSTPVDLFGAFISVHVAGFPADEGLTCFDGARHFVDAPGMHRVTDAVKHEPRRCLSDFQIAGDFVGTDTVFALGDEPHCTEPFIEPNRGIFEDGSDLNRELFLAVQALPHHAGLEERKPLRLASWAGWTRCTPLSSRYQTETYFGVGKGADRFHQTTGVLGLICFHETHYIRSVQVS